MTSQDDHFREWCQEFYKTQYAGMDVNDITDTPGQLTKGDTEIVPGFGDPNIYFDHKVNRRKSNELLVELIQSAATPKHPNFLGWFYNLTECNFILMGYYDGPASCTLESAYKIDLKKLREWFLGLKQKLENNEIKVTSQISPKGFGITLMLFIPYEPLEMDGIAERIA